MIGPTKIYRIEKFDIRSKNSIRARPGVFDVCWSIGLIMYYYILFFHPCRDTAARMGGFESDFGVPLYTSYFSNFVGCFLIGFFGQMAKCSLKTAFTTGLCGCLTTFSGWNNQQVISLNVHEKQSYGFEIFILPIKIVGFI